MNSSCFPCFAGFGWVGGFSLLCVFQFLRWNFPHCFPGLGGWAAAERATIKEGGRIISRLLFRLPPARQQNNKEIQSLELIQIETKQQQELVVAPIATISYYIYITACTAMRC